MTVDLNSRYGLTPTHSEVVQACEIIAPCNTLDMGCSNGRNALYLNQRGFNVTGIDTNESALDMLQNIIIQESLTEIHTHAYDINSANIQDQYGFISCTVTLMFIDPTRIDAVIANMQNATLAEGYNLIVCAMNTEENPCPMPFPFTLQANQLRNAYQNWEIIKYNEDVGTMHNGAKLQFATMLAKKPCS